MSTGTVDPLDFVLALLRDLPNDPRDSKSEHLQILAAAQEGMARHARRLADAAAELDERLDGTDLHDALRDRASLARLEGRTRRAAARLDAYAIAALKAHGVNIAATGGDDQTGAP
jgi:hypothetical protein